MDLGNLKKRVVVQKVVMEYLSVRGSRFSEKNGNLELI